MDPEQFELSLNLIPHVLKDTLIHQRPADGFVNATAMCRAARKKFGDYYRLGTTKEYLRALSSVTGIPVTLLVTLARQGGVAGEQVTWVHPDVAMHLGWWCSPDFAVAVAQWVREWTTGNAQRPQVSVHLRRYEKNRTKIPPDRFSMLSETTLEIVGPLEIAGHVLPDNLGLDISAGILFCRFLRDKGIDTDTFATYQHEFESGKTVEAKLYPIELIGEFRKFLREVWLPLKAPKYFKKRDPSALRYLPRPLPPPSGGEATP